jgi:hypothetical protein
MINPLKKTYGGCPDNWKDAYDVSSNEEFERDVRGELMNKWRVVDNSPDGFSVRRNKTKKEISGPSKCPDYVIADCLSEIDAQYIANALNAYDNVPKEA